MTSTFELDVDDVPHQSRKRPRTELYALTAQDAKSVIGQPQSSRISNAFAGLVDKKTATTGSLRLVPDGTGFLLTITDLAEFDEHAVHTAIRNSGVWVSRFLVRLGSSSSSSATVTFSKVPARSGTSQVYRCLEPFLSSGSGSGSGSTKTAEKLLAEELVPSPQDREMLSSLVHYWMNFRGPRDTPEGMYWTLTCLDGTVIDSKTGASSKAVVGAAVENKQYTLLIFGAHDATLPELMEPACMLPAHVAGTAVVPSLGALRCVVRTYTSPLKHYYVRSPIDYSPD